MVRKAAKNHITFITALVILACLSLSFSSHALNPEARGQVDEPDGVVLRAGPTTESERLAVLHDRTQVTVKKIIFTEEASTDDKTLWYSVSTSSGEGYIRSDLIKITNYRTAAASAAGDKECRAGAGYAMSIAGTISSGGMFTVKLEAESSDHGAWYMIEKDDAVMYISAENVTVTETEQPGEDKVGR